MISLNIYNENFCMTNCQLFNTMCIRSCDSKMPERNAKRKKKYKTLGGNS